MFILEDRSGKRVALLEEEPGVMRHLLARGEAEKYPMWALVDDASPAWFSSDRMEQLIADLRRLKSTEEIAARQTRWRQRIERDIAWLEADLARGPDPSATMLSVLSWMRDAHCRAQQQPPEFPEPLRAEVVVPYVDAIIALARRCHEMRGFLGHNPFENEID